MHTPHMCTVLPSHFTHTHTRVTSIADRLNAGFALIHKEVSDHYLELLTNLFLLLV